MGAVLNFIIDSIQESFFHPARFIRRIKNHPPLDGILKIPPQTANANQIIHWDKWDGCHFDKKYVLNLMKRYESIQQQYIPELEHLVTVNETKNWWCDIRDIDCLSSSKSNLNLFTTLDEFATTVNSNLIADVSEQNLDKNLQWERGRILNKPSFYCYGWDNKRIHLCNSGGSHHFSAARYLASQLNKKVPICGNLYTFNLNAQSVFSLLNQFDLFSINSEDWSFISDECIDFDAPFGFYPAPRPFYDQTIMFLPRNNKRSMRISKLLKQIQLFDFSLFLLKSLKKQENESEVELQIGFEK
ncbi:DUF6685 family protein [uncultured Legionella sp.]|uniref:DUF6685 family protein n=1 Tax=uncultured Legionella sp. TaxID=210934 RepID=UPI002612F066|nr:DUF6685 family protein [uncultured Legionella sp.]